MTQHTLILASSSPYRAELLRRLSLPFECISPDIDETHQIGESASELVQRLATSKARKIAESHPQAVIIGSDQVAVVGEQILGKPGSYDRAVQQLAQIAGKKVVFHTGLCVLHASSNQVQVADIEYTVVMRELTATEIERYCQVEQPYNCAGSFKSEGLGITLFEKMQGDDPSALIGLPLIRLSEMLRNLGVELP